MEEDLKSATGPIYERFLNGRIHRVRFVRKGQLHRNYKEGPADTIYNRQGTLQIEGYYHLGKFHRPVHDGPALIIYNGAGDVYTEEYHEHGFRIVPEERALVKSANKT